MFVKFWRDQRSQLHERLRSFTSKSAALQAIERIDPAHQLGPHQRVRRHNQQAGLEGIQQCGGILKATDVFGQRGGIGRVDPGLRMQSMEELERALQNVATELFALGQRIILGAATIESPSAAMPAFAICTSSLDFTPDTPTAPTQAPSTMIGTPPSSGVTGSTPRNEKRPSLTIFS